jgi:membrane protease YdiL (CAAX protease family)
VVDERLSPPWRAWEALPIAVAAVVASGVASLVFTAIFGSAGGPALLLTGLSFQLALALFTILWVAIRHRGWVPALGLRSARGERDVAVGGFVGAGSYGLIRFVVAPAVIVVWDAIVGHPPGSSNQFPGIDFGVPEIALGVVLVVLVTPIGEEVFYRGFLFGGLRGRMGFWGAALISGGLFGLSHLAGGAVLVPLLFVFGLTQAFLYERRRSLVAPIAAHAMFNLIGFAAILMQHL